MTRSPYKIARQLLECGYIQKHHFEVWIRHQCGESIHSMRRDYPRETGTGNYHVSTLYDWVKKVEAVIAEVRAAPPDHPEEAMRNPFGHSVAEGHAVRFVSDKTPVRSQAHPEAQKEIPSSFPDPEQMRIIGKRPRF